MTSYNLWVDGRDKIARQNLRGYRVSMTFEGYTGADLILTPLSSIISTDTIQSHLDAGAVMIQLKNSRDFDASVRDQRLFESLARMNTWSSFQYQNGLLITGDFEISGDRLYIDGKLANISSSSYLGALNSWVVRGGVVYPPIDVTDMQRFIDLLGQKLFVGDPFTRTIASRPRKKFKLEKKFTKGMTLKEKIRIASSDIDKHDLRHVLINIDGLSNSNVNDIWKMLEKGNRNMIGFVHLVNSGRIKNIKGIGPKTVEKIKKQLGYI